MLELCPSIHDPFSLCECALLFAYVDESESSTAWTPKIIEILNSAAEGVSGGVPLGPGLFKGLSGVGWIIEHVTKIILMRQTGLDEKSDDEADDPIDAIDDYLVQHLAAEKFEGPYDLIDGLVGMGVFCLERLPRETAIRGVELIIEILCDSADVSASGVTWHTPANRLSTLQSKLCPSGYFNLGVAHGVPAVVHFLGEAIAARIEEAKSKNLLDGAIKWLLDQQRPSGLSRYGDWIAPGQHQRDSRLSWCYGDLGIAAVLHHVAGRLGNRHWYQAAEALSNRCVSRLSEIDDVCDAQLCHGALGVAHIFNRIYQMSGDVVYREAANLWFERGLGMRHGQGGIGGFFAWHPGKDSCWTADHSLLSGSIGICLALISATTVVEPKWDRLLLLSGRDNSELNGTSRH